LDSKQLQELSTASFLSEQVLDIQPRKCLLAGFWQLTGPVGVPLAWTLKWKNCPVESPEFDDQTHKAGGHYQAAF